MNETAPDSQGLGRKHRVLLRLERFSRERYGVVFLLAALLAGLGAWLGTRLSIESDILALIPAGNERVDRFKEAVTDFGAVSYLLVLFENDSGEDTPQERLEAFADLFAEDLASDSELVEQVEYRLEPDEGVLELFYENALLFLPPERLADLAAKLERAAIDERIEQNRLELASPMGDLTRDLLLNDPLGLMPLFLDRLLGNQRGIRVDVSDGYYLSQDGTKLIMLVKPTGPWQDLEFDKRLLSRAREIEAGIRESFADEGESAEAISVRYSGHYAIAVDQESLIREDLSYNLVASLACVALFYLISYRRFAALLYSSVPLLVGQAMTFGLAWWVLGTLNAASSAFTALLMGLGTDFVIVMYARYVEERRAGRTLEEATELMVGETGLGVFTGAITSAGTFFALWVSDFEGLKHLGFLIGGGILLCAVAIVFMVPAMIQWNEGVRRRKVESLRKLHVQSFLLEHLIPFSARHRVPVITVVLVLTAVSAWFTPSIEFDDTVNALRSNRSPAFRVQQEIADEFGASLSFMMAVARGRDVEEAVENTREIEERLAPFLADGTVSSHDSILSYLPPESRQREILSELAADRSGRFDPARVRGDFLAALDEHGFRPEAFEAFLARIDRFLAPERPLALADLEAQGLEHLIRRYVRRDDDGVRIVTYLTLLDPRWKRDPPPGLIEAVTGGEPDIVVTGTNVVGAELRRIFTVEARKAVALGLVIVLILLLVDFRSVRLTAVALIQLLCGVTIMFGAMKLLDIHLNYVNAFVATMILGVGIDYSIHLVHRMSLTEGRIESGLLETGKAVVIAAFTNMAAFGVLAFGNYPALRSFGTVAVLGSLTCLLTSLTFVPAVMARRDD